MINFGDKFPETYFPSSSTMKKDYLSKADFSGAIAEGRAKINSIIASAVISDLAVDWCLNCFAKAPDEFFYMPTSSTGKYHGGPKDLCNCVGGNIVHTEQVLAMATKVLNRYESALGVFYDHLSEALRVACILHDICKYTGDSVWTSKTHGEDGANLIRSVESDYDFKGLVAEAVEGHMYYWRFLTVFDSLQAFGAGSLNGLFLSFMLSECDYYSIK